MSRTEGGSGAGLCEVRTGRKLWTFSGYWRRDAPVFGKDGKTVMLAHGSRALVLNLETGQPAAEHAMPDPVSAATFRPDGRVSYSMQKGGTIRAFEAASGKEIWARRLQNGHGGTLTLTSDGKVLVAAMNGPPRAAHPRSAAAGRCWAARSRARSSFRLRSNRTTPFCSW